MRVLHVVTLHTPTHRFGGPTRVALHLARGQRARGDRATVLALGDGFEGEQPREVDGVPVKLFPARHVLPRFEVSGITSPALLARAWAYVQSADVVHVHLMRDLVTLPVALVALQARRPLVLQTHGMVDPSDKRVARLVDVLGMRRVLKKADAVLHLTATERDATAAVVAPEPMAPAYRLVNGVPVQKEVRPTGVGRPPTVLFAARLQDVKRPQDFVSAMPTVLKEHPEARFVMAGPDTGPLAADMLALARRLGVEHALEYLGPLPHAEVLRRMRTADVYVLPSIFEPFAVSALEAMSVGVPVVVTGSGGVSPDVAAAGAGRVVDSVADADNGELVGRAVCELLEPAANAEASAAGLRVIRERFTDDSVVESLAEIYGRVMAARR
ncbi:glycosyltransferase [Streptomyces sp. ACA25]|uniref:glycosyltransferase n=1 Tax=Streptomyces sp. ACA25 TaxID=3022596 RepID=UPI0023073BAB|nr:glycosyltransferase [Streptomyces sp. ACA25]MDB1087818.1 glycosyltransferase [Streptomyces sp. ACA25]